MPVARINARRSWSPTEVEALIDAVYLAQREALAVPQDDRNIRYVEHRPEHFAVPSTATDRFVLVEIALYPGRSDDAKRRLQLGIVERFGALGIAPSDVFVILSEPPLANWAVAGIPGADREVPFALDV